MKGDSSGGRRFCLCFGLTWLLAFKLVHSKVFQTAAKGRSRGIAWESTLHSAEMNRIGSACSKDDILVYEGQTAPLPDGIPTYTVQILNACVSGCSISNIHVKCGWFSSARLVNPRVFRRIHYDDCLINDGKALGPGQTLSFQYANTFPYTLSVSSVTCS